MDLVGQICTQAGLQRRLLDISTLDHYPVAFPCERSMGMHIILRGPVFLHVYATGDLIPLATGDVAFMARGIEHVLSRSDARPAETAVPQSLMQLASLDQIIDVAGSAMVLSGAYQFWNRPLHPFFKDLPDVSILKKSTTPTNATLATLIACIKHELLTDGMCKSTIIHGLIDAIFGFVLRDMVRSGSQAQVGWSIAATNVHISKSMKAMQSDIKAPWTLETLAARAGLSRTTYAQRFRAFTHDTPLNYLRVLRMQEGARLLVETTWSLEHIASEVGYGDAFSFSKIFKRHTGFSPRDYRQKDQLEKHDVWRFKSLF